MTTSTGQAEEVAFTRGFEHESEPPEAQKPVWREYTFQIARGLVNIHGMVHSVADVVSALASKVRSVADRGPEDYAQSDFERGVRAGARMGSYNEAPKQKPENNIKTVIVSCTVALLSAFFIGAWKLSNDSAALRAEFNEWKTSTNEWKAATDRRMERLENRRQ